MESNQKGDNTLHLCRDYRRVEKAIHYLTHNFKKQPSLTELAAESGMSCFHFQRLFRRWAGITPKRFLQFLTVQYARQCLEESLPVLETALESGLSGPSRLHDLFVAVEAMTPGEYRSGGKGLRIRFGFTATSFGEVLMATTGRGICELSFLTGADRDGAIEGLRFRWPGASLQQQDRALYPLFAEIFDPSPAGKNPIRLHLRGTNFQLRVWKALLQIPPGFLICYQDLARFISAPRAQRAVAGAVAANPVAFLIPCHRVIRKNGRFGGYAGGPLRKQALIGWEAARRREGSGPGSGGA